MLNGWTNSNMAQIGVTVFVTNGWNIRTPRGVNSKLSTDRWIQSLLMALVLFLGFSSETWLVHLIQIAWLWWPVPLRTSLMTDNLFRLVIENKHLKGLTSQVLGSSRQHNELYFKLAATRDKCLLSTKAAFVSMHMVNGDWSFATKFKQSDHLEALHSQLMCRNCFRVETGLRFSLQNHCLNAHNCINSDAIQAKIQNSSILFVYTFSDTVTVPQILWLHADCVDEDTNYTVNLKQQFFSGVSCPTLWFNCIRHIWGLPYCLQLGLLN